MDWSQALEAAWRDVTACVGTPSAPDRGVRLYVLDRTAPPFTTVVNGLPQGAWYDGHTHAVIIRHQLRDSLRFWRHEFVHASRRDTAKDHAPVFALADSCGFSHP
jgi:hypothetical protein